MQEEMNAAMAQLNESVGADVPSLAEVQDKIQARYAKAKAAWQAFQNKYRTAAGVDIDAELATLKTTLQGIFDEVPAP